MRPTDTTLPQVIDDCHELLKWLIPLPDKFPRTQLSAANRRLSSVRHLWRLAYELRGH